MADDEKIIAMKRSELVELVRQILAEMPTKLPADGGNADTVNNHTVKSDVPENAVFTDTVPDLSGYAMKTDIPSSLPANGGNADTVDGKHASDFLQSQNPTLTGNLNFVGGTTDTKAFAYGNTVRLRNIVDENNYSDLTLYPEGAYEERMVNGVYQGAQKLLTPADPNVLYPHGYYTANVDDIKRQFCGLIINATQGTPKTTVWGTLVCFAGGTGSLVQLWVNADDNATMFKRHFNGNSWSEWKEICTTDSQYHSTGTITGLSNGTAKTISLPFSPVFVLFHSNGHVVQSGFALSCGTNSFTITPANVTTMGTIAVGYIAFGG